MRKTIFCKAFLLILAFITLMEITILAQPTQIWATRYSGPTAGNDEAIAIAIDSSKNVYVTGSSYNMSWNLDYATVMYNSSGVQQWVSRYNGPGDGEDRANAITADSSGNCYVTGKCINSSGNADYATIKYLNDGAQAWATRYDGPANLDDEAYAIAVDDSGNVYVTGKSLGGVGDLDYVTVKYNSLGTQEWAIRYSYSLDDVAYAIDVDNSGNIYVTGGEWRINTIKYNSAGTQQWFAYYDTPPGSHYDRGRAIFVDGSGNVYVTGSGIGDGTQWDYITVKYNSSGVQQWASRYDFGFLDDSAIAITVDGSENVYVTGSSYSSTSNDDYATIKYNSSGVQEWVARYNGTGNSQDISKDIELDGLGNVYVTGWSYRTGFYNDYSTIKYNNSGVKQWEVHYHGGSDSDYGQGLCVDSSNDIYVTGFSMGSGTSNDYATIKYSENPDVDCWINY